MPKVVRQRWLGLNTKAEEEALPLEYAADVQNFRMETGRLKPRRGRDRVNRAAGNMGALDLNGSNMDVVVGAPIAAWTLKREWTFRQVIEPDTVVGTQYLVGWSNTTRPFVLFLDGSTLTWTVVDVDDGSTTLTASGITAAKTVIQCERVGTALTLYVDGASADTDTMADKDCKSPTGNLHLGSDQSSNYYNGTMDGPELFDGTLPPTRGLVRHEDPITCRAWYDFKSQGNSIYRDLSRFRNHGKGQNSPGAVSALSHSFRPVRGLAPYVNRGGRRRMFSVAHNVPYIHEVT